MAARPRTPPEGVRTAVYACAGAAVVLLGAAGCARQEAPTGGPQDTRPPVVVSTEPAPFATVGEVDAVRFHFDERISERVSGGALETAVTVSPRGGEVRVGHGRRTLTVEMEGGFVPGVVYRVTLHAAVADLFSNRMTDPFELVFSTGPEPVATTLAGEVWDRVSGSAVTDAVVLAVDTEGLVHEARTDDRGIFAFRYVAPGALTVSAFEDRNRDAVLDSAETQGTMTTSLAVGDTALIDLSVLAPDTSAAALSDADVLDSVTVVVAFDDFLDPDFDASALTPTVSGPSGTTGVVEVYQEAAYAAWVDMVSDSLARLDSIDAANRPPPPPPAPADTTQAPPPDTTVAAPTDSAVAPPTDTAAADLPGALTDAAALPGAATGPAPEQEALIQRPRPTPLQTLPGERPGPMADSSRVLPGRRLVLILAEPLAYDVEYEVEVGGVVNINGLAGGGGSATFLHEAPPPPEPAAADTTGVGLPIDTLAVPTDTLVTPPDTGRVETRDPTTSSSPRDARR